MLITEESCTFMYIWSCFPITYLQAMPCWTSHTQLWNTPLKNAAVRVVCSVTAPIIVQGTLLSLSNQEAVGKRFYILETQDRNGGLWCRDVRLNGLVLPLKEECLKFAVQEGWLFAQCSFSKGHKWIYRTWCDYNESWKCTQVTGAMKSDDCPCDAVLVNLDLSLLIIK